ncbi:uncharacterized protein KNAG_0C00770 [Huiozyma naganishii CBS 8797]|uniref:Cyclin-like domain-containing protein n=1 Tax=Huiozyma naganishii (strain ATCC MYA-139 / BCRC 22969 / CBS 8797 / KCTC 17520 / NBRC 10181 / NCYC 3082 / Yp74L-3) TaxID=1071383 RepID=J7R2Y2_HUIN7|nr:hypothetical protein KNAG_0C00770 [Kazachstania naganishii CBS 8797]CCK69190.1 hypothetical protein KNAG_0C00770 [Kazachstania naganishii CBS 8797]
MSACKRKQNVQLHPNLVKNEQITANATIKPYKEDILLLYHDLDVAHTGQLNPVMIDNQPEIKWNMRPFLIDFLVELHVFFDLSPETLYLAASIADRYCSKRIVYKRHYQLLIATSLWIAAKYQDKKIEYPILKELYLLCYQIYDPQMFVQMERHILTTLDWTVGHVTTATEILHLLFDQCPKLTLLPKTGIVCQFTNFLLDFSLYHRDYLCFNHSTRAVSALLVASCIVGDDTFPNHFKRLLQQQPKEQKQDEKKCSAPLLKYIAGDSENHDLDLHITRDKMAEIRQCVFLHLQDLFMPRMARATTQSNSNKFKISQVLLKKYKAWPVRALVDKFTAANFELFVHLNGLLESRDALKRDGFFIQPWLPNSIAMFIDYFVSLGEIRYDSDVVAAGQAEYGPAPYREAIVQHAEAVSRVPTPLEFMTPNTACSRFSSSSATPLLLRSTSSISDNSISNASSRSSSIFSQPITRVDSSQFIDTITPVTATFPHVKNRSNTFTAGTIKQCQQPSSMLSMKGSSNSTIPPTPTLLRHKSQMSFSGSSNLFSISQSPKLSDETLLESMDNFISEVTSAQNGILNFDQIALQKKK